MTSEQIPVGMAGHNELNQTKTPLSYDLICEMIGHLYIECRTIGKDAEERANVAIQALRQKIAEQQHEIDALTDTNQQLKQKVSDG